ncbi:MAG: GNAT family N-acetyltransferase [Acidimicrobiia bacterium]
MTPTVRPADAADTPWVLAVARSELGDERQVHSRRQFHVLDAAVLVAELDGEPAGFLTWDHDAAVAEILAVAVARRRRGLGRALVAAVERIAAEAGCRVLTVVTTDDNLGAQRFYESVDFALRERRAGAVDECRRRYKPTIPAAAHDELEYERAISAR